jgi:hypothetical protein
MPIWFGRLRRAERQTNREFKPDFSSSEPLLKFGLTPRAAEALLWLAQGKTNSVVLSVETGTKSPIFSGYTSLLWHYPELHLHYTFADLFADSGSKRLESSSTSDFGPRVKNFFPRLFRLNSRLPCSE